MILILGTGMLGTELVRCMKLERRSYLVLSHDELDLTHAHKAITDKLTRFSNVTHIINAAGFTKVDAAEQNKEEALKTNAYGANKLAQFCATHNITLVQVSTDFIFDGTNSVDHPYIEEDKPNPINYYGYTKLLGEQMVKESGCKYLIIRTGKLYNQEKGFIFSIINKMKSERQMYGVRNQTFTPTSAFNLAWSILEMIEHNITGVYHVTNGGHTSALELVEFIKKEMKSSTKIDPVSLYETFSIARRPEMTVLSNDKFNSLGLSMLPMWDEALKYTLRAIQLNPDSDKSSNICLS